MELPTARKVIFDFLAQKKDEPMLEIGPLMSPRLTRDIYNVYYADIRSRDEIRDYYVESNMYPSLDELERGLVPIDFVIKDSYEETVKREAGDLKFSAVFSSHVLEHVHDVIFHLRDLSRILTDDGFIVMFIPDKRLTFDYFRYVTPFRDMLDVYLNGSVSQTARLAFDEKFTVHPSNNAANHFNHLETFLTMIESGDDERYKEALDLYMSVRDDGHIASFHNWVFTYESFLDFLRDGLRAKLLPFNLFYSHSPCNENIVCNDFCIVLQKNGALLEDDKARIREIRKLIEIREHRSDFLTSKIFISKLIESIDCKPIQYSHTGLLKIERVNDVEPPREPSAGIISFNKKDGLLLNGWVVDTLTDASPYAVYVKLNSNMYSTMREIRLDAVSRYKNLQYNLCGFCAFIPADSLEYGGCELSLIIITSDGEYLYETKTLLNLSIN